MVYSLWMGDAPLLNCEGRGFWLEIGIICRCIIAGLSGGPGVLRTLLVESVGAVA
jgi:hypothetical protein